MADILWFIEKGLWPVALFFIGFSLLWRDTSELKDDKETRAAYARFVQRGGTKAYYRRILTRVLDWLDARLSTEEADLSVTHRAHAWNFRVLNLCLAVALGDLALQPLCPCNKRP